jgi:hypothetical protein
MKILIAILIIILSTACTTYSVTKTMPDGSTVDVKVVSSREFAQPELHYIRQGEDAEFHFGAESVTTYDPSAEIISGILSGKILIKPDNN